MISAIKKLKRDLEKYENKYDWEKRFKIIREREGRRLVSYVNALVRKFGPKVYKILGNETRKFTYTRYKKIIDELGIKEKDAIAAVKLLSYGHLISGPKGEVIEASPKKSVRIERECPMKDIYTYEICKNIVSLPALQGICKAIHPNLVASHPNYLTRGDDVCKMVFEMKS